MVAAGAIKALCSGLNNADRVTLVAMAGEVLFMIAGIKQLNAPQLLGQGELCFFLCVG